MPTDRRFAAFSKSAAPPRMRKMPEGGMCISAFLIVSKRNEPDNILMGKINEDANWDHIGALDAKRVQRHRGGWMLPSSHLMLFETPEGAARRILREQLHVRDMKITGPLTFVDTSGNENHWDIGFIFLAEGDNVPKSDAWRELRFVKTKELDRDDVVRSQVEVLDYAGRWKGAVLNGPTEVRKD
jgi:ADP-ribose pyrophosphatase YjhB (NUDIX family)